MFNIGDYAYIVSSADFSTTRILKILKYKISNILSSTKVCLDAQPPINVNTWAIGKTPHQAVKIGLTFLINKIELNKDINTFTIKDYEYLEQNHSDLIFKYMAKVVEDY